MIVTMKSILDDAVKNGYSVAAPNVGNETTIRGALETAEELRAPVILDFAWIMCGDNFESVLRMARDMARDATVPVAINLDHGTTLEQCMIAIHSGVTSIMVDRSELSYEDNVYEVKEMAKYAHACNVTVESELGHVPSGTATEEEIYNGLTDPKMAKDFVERTGIDCLAVAIGTAHGRYASKPKIYFDRLQEVKQAVQVPLVLHGSSGTGDENLARAVKEGITKVNIYTALAQNGVDKLKEKGLDWTFDITMMEKVMMEGYKEKLRYYMHMFGQVGKAD